MLSIPVVALIQVLSYLMLFVYIWYFSYKNVYKYGCCFICSSSFWNPRAAIRSEFHLSLLIIHRGIDNREKDSLDSERNHSIIYSFSTKVFESCTAVKELHMEILPNQVFTLLGPVYELRFNEE